MPKPLLPLVPLTDEFDGPLMIPSAADVLVHTGFDVVKAGRYLENFKDFIQSLDADRLIGIAEKTLEKQKKLSFQVALPPIERRQYNAVLRGLVCLCYEDIRRRGEYSEEDREEYSDEYSERRRQ